MLERAMEQIFGPKLTALIVKETREMLRNKYLMFLILIPPVVQLLILGASLDPKVSNLSLLTFDQSQSKLSRDLVSSLLDTTIFKTNESVSSQEELQEKMKSGHYDVGLFVPQHFAVSLNEGKKAEVVVYLDGANAYTSGIARNFVVRTFDNFRSQGLGAKLLVDSLEEVPEDFEMERGDKVLVSPKIDMLFNSAMKGSWYFIPGILGACLTLVGTLVASALVLKESESGTIQQLLMTPASTWHILLAKILPLLVFLMVDVVLAILFAHLIFGMPVRGDVFLLLLASMLYALTGIGAGILLGTFCATQRQAQLSSFFINIPMILLSGAVVPFDTMPPLLQAISSINPLRYYTITVRSLILKGSSFEMVQTDLLILFAFSFLILVVGSFRMRRSLVA